MVHEPLAAANITARFASRAALVETVDNSLPPPCDAEQNRAMPAPRRRSAQHLAATADALFVRRDVLERQVRAVTPGTHRYRRLARELHEVAALINKTLAAEAT
jgi:hypothetical protein